MWFSLLQLLSLFFSNESSWGTFLFFQESQRTEQQQHEKVPGREKKGNYNLESHWALLLDVLFHSSVERMKKILILC